MDSASGEDSYTSDREDRSRDSDNNSKDDSSDEVNPSAIGEQIYKIVHDAALLASVFSCAKSFTQSHPGILFVL